MKELKIFFITLIVTLLVTGVGLAKMYKWVDENGIIHFSDHPPENTGSVGEVKQIPTYKSESQSNSSDAAGDLKNRPDDGSQTGKKSEQRQTPAVELYTTSWCPYCKKAVNFFQSRGIPFTEYNIEKDKSAARRKRQMDPRGGVPFAVVNGQRIRGFSETAYLRALEMNP